MRITDNAIKAIIHIMKSKGLDTKKTFFEIGVFNGNLGISFTRESMGNIIENGELTIVISNDVDKSDFVIDFVESNGKKGIIFLGEKNVDNIN